jgi:hypothetical protein
MGKIEKSMQQDNAMERESGRPWTYCLYQDVSNRRSEKEMLMYRLEFP